MPRIPSQSPTLAAPGAGLPWPELWIARMLFTFSRWSYSRDAANQNFLSEQKAIAALIEKCGPTLACRRVLIPRLRGLEDSSRFWSVAMALEHLRITNTAFAEIIRLLAKNITPPGVASTADVKPSTDVSWQVVGEYDQSCSQVMAAVAETPLKTVLKFAHPWFGGMTWEDWHLLAAVHMRIHRKQIETILKQLSVSPLERDQARDWETGQQTDTRQSNNHALTPSPKTGSLPATAHC
jgi:uncharacterized damage-inducible protein DinB